MEKCAINGKSRINVPSRLCTKWKICQVVNEINKSMFVLCTITYYVYLPIERILLSRTFLAMCLYLIFFANWKKSESTIEHVQFRVGYGSITPGWFHLVLNILLFFCWPSPNEKSGEQMKPYKMGFWTFQLFTGRCPTVSI